MKDIVTPYLTVDIIIKYKGGIVLINRKYKPYGWALPGGFVNYGERVEEAAIREAKEETSLNIKLEKQFHVYSDPKRDPRMHTVSVVFVATGKGKLRASDDAKEANVFSPDKVPELCFDHNRIIEDFIKYEKPRI